MQEDERGGLEGQPWIFDGGGDGYSGFQQFVCEQKIKMNHC